MGGGCDSLYWILVTTYGVNDSSGFFIGRTGTVRCTPFGIDKSPGAICTDTAQRSRPEGMAHRNVRQWFPCKTATQS